MGDSLYTCPACWQKMMTGALPPVICPYCGAERRPDGRLLARKAFPQPRHCRICLQKFVSNSIDDTLCLHCILHLLYQEEAGAAQDQQLDHDASASAAGRAFRNGWASSAAAQCLSGIGAPCPAEETPRGWGDKVNDFACDFWRYGRRERAVECWRLVLQDEPRHLEASFNLNYVLWKQGLCTAEEIVERICLLENEHGGKQSFWQGLAWIHFEQGNQAELERITGSAGRIASPELQDALTHPARPGFNLNLTIPGSKNEGEQKCLASPDGVFLSAYVPGSGVLRLWDLQTGRERVCRMAGGDAVQTACFSPDSASLFTGSRRGEVRRWPCRAGSGRTLSRDNENPVKSMVFAPNGHYLAVSSSDDEMQLYRLNGPEGELTASQIGIFPRAGSHVAFSPDSKRLLALGDRSNDDSRGLVMDINQRFLWSERMADLRGDEWDQADEFAFAVSGNVVAGISWKDRSTRIWAFSSPELRARYDFEGSDGSVCIAPGNDWCLVAASIPPQDCGQDSCSSELRIWNLGRNWLTIRREFSGERITTLGFDHNGWRMLTGTASGSIKMWSMSEDAELGTFRGHRTAITAMGMSADDKLLLSASADGNIRLWRTDTGQNLCSRYGPAGAVQSGLSAMFAPDCRRVCLLGDGARCFSLLQDGHDWGAACPHPLYSRESREVI